MKLSELCRIDTCEDCTFRDLTGSKRCMNKDLCINCERINYPKAVKFKEIKNMKEVKIQIPDNCELIKDGDTYIIKEKDSKPRTWNEFCEKYPVKVGECVITSSDYIHCVEVENAYRLSKNYCTSKQEAEAFLALMQLRQLRKAWVGDYKQAVKCAGIFYSIREDKIVVSYDEFWTNVALSFPTKEMAIDFLDCFKDLCETAKILL